MDKFKFKSNENYEHGIVDCCNDIGEEWIRLRRYLSGQDLCDAFELFLTNYTKEAGGSYARIL